MPVIFLIPSHVQASLEKQRSEHEESLSEWKIAESQLQACVLEMTEGKGYLTEKVDTLEQELNKSRAQLSQIEAKYAESIETVKFVFFIMLID